MKIYTGTGDRGYTSLFSGERVPKHHERLQAYGDLDELSSFLGLLISALSPKETGVIRQLTDIQSNLLKMGAWLATTPDSSSACILEELSDDPRIALEKAIDSMQERLEPLNRFILPGGHESAGFAHVARTVCRRAERHAVAVYSDEEEQPGIDRLLVYLNRLSDYLFVLARCCNVTHGFRDTVWEPA